MYKIIFFLCIKFTTLNPLFCSANIMHSPEGFNKNVHDSSHTEMLPQKLFDHYYDHTFNQLDSNRLDLALLAIAYAEEQAWKSGDSLKIIKAGRVKKQILRRLNRDSHAICMVQEVLAITFRHRNINEVYLLEYVDLLRTLSISYAFTANYSKALEFGFNSLALYEIMGDKVEVFNQLNNMGLIYYKL